MAAALELHPFDDGHHDARQKYQYRVTAEREQQQN